MYTSGSTGAPKGVLGTHSGLINRLIWQYEQFPYTPRSSSFEWSDSTNSGEESECSALPEEPPNGERCVERHMRRDELKDGKSGTEGREEEAAASVASDDNLEKGEDGVVGATAPNAPFRGEVICRRTPVSPVKCSL
jgi:acyl-CoA synthetase (AMP-forming)/AMP-acid ligase II